MTLKSISIPQHCQLTECSCGQYTGHLLYQLETQLETVEEQGCCCFFLSLVLPMEDISNNDTVTMLVSSPFVIVIKAITYLLFKSWQEVYDDAMSLKPLNTHFALPEEIFSEYFVSKICCVYVYLLFLTFLHAFVVSIIT